ncbi:hypothetical protein [Chryseobacterium sp.]|uniref:hypothetical protein n=1 Tax=Chryseobacterium sp. TaxID=1871047 RepID=UPI0031CDF9E5
MELQIGDVVYLNSDLNMNVLMTVSGKDGALFYCTWFSGNDVKQHLFHKDSLTKYK